MDISQSIDNTMEGNDYQRLSIEKGGNMQDIVRQFTKRKLQYLRHLIRYNTYPYYYSTYYYTKRKLMSPHKLCPFLALRPEFHSNLRVFLSTPRYCQSATFGRLTVCVYTLLFFTEFAFNVATPTARTPRPSRKQLCDKRGLHAEL